MLRRHETYVSLGCDKIESILSCPFATHPVEHDYEYASYPGECSLKVSTIAGILTAASP